MEFGKFLGSGFARAYISTHPDCSKGLEITLIAIAIILCCAIGYLIGSVNFAIILSKAQHSDDVRKYGSNNAGATNMLRTYGKKAAIATFFGDFGKALVACFIGYVCFGNDGAYFAGLFCVLGHIFPMFFKFKGGKGVSTTAGVMLACDPGTFVVIFIVYFGILLTTRFVSLASVMSAALYPLILQRMNIIFGIIPGFHIILAMFMSIVVIYKHVPNIKRIINKTEPKLDLSKLSKKKKNKDKNEIAPTDSDQNDESKKDDKNSDNK